MRSQGTPTKAAACAPAAAPSKIPHHVAIIMDGNGRWAKARGLPRLAGHRAGTENVRRIVQSFCDAGVACLTLYAFSTENWSRPANEVNGLMDILGDAIGREAANLHREGVRIVHVGELGTVRPELQTAVHEAVELTKDNTRMTLAVAFNYGGRADILQAVRRIVADGLPPDQIDETTISRYLHTHELPDPDLIIRTAGEMRLSNFLLWEAAYAEYYSTPVFWPDFGPAEVREALNAYGGRQRRFGALNGEESPAHPAE